MEWGCGRIEIVLDVVKSKSRNASKRFRKRLQSSGLVVVQPAILFLITPDSVGQCHLRHIFDQELTGPTSREREKLCMTACLPSWRTLIRPSNTRRMHDSERRFVSSSSGMINFIIARVLMVMVMVVVVVAGVVVRKKNREGAQLEVRYY